MPTQWTIDLALTADVAGHYRYDALHAVACGFFEQSGSDHDSERKPFAVRLAEQSAVGATLALVWLPDEPPPATVTPTTLRLGPCHGEVTAFRVTKTLLAGLGCGATPGRVRLRALSPTKFRHHGRDYPLPDPHLTYHGLARRVSALSPGIIVDDVVRELTRSVVVYDHDIRTESFSWHGGRSAGFVGSVTFGIPRTCGPAVRRAFAVLNEFAAIAGVGHGTTHGLGAVRIEPSLSSGTSAEQRPDRIGEHGG
jgi:hypothetical protein